MTNTQYSISLTVTYVPYIVAELPSNLTLKVCVEAFCVVMHLTSNTRQAVGPNLMLPSMLALWGVVTTLQGTYDGDLLYGRGLSFDKY